MILYPALEDVVMGMVVADAVDDVYNSAVEDARIEPIPMSEEDAFAAAIDDAYEAVPESVWDAACDDGECEGHVD